MDRKTKLLEELRKLDEQIQAIRDKEKQTPEDVTELNGLCDQVEAVDVQLKAEERGAEINERNRAPVETPGSEEKPSGGDQSGYKIDADASQEEKDRALGEMLQDVARAASPAGANIGGKPCGVIDRRLLAMQAEQRAVGLQEGIPALGGFLVQKDFADGLRAEAKIEIVDGSKGD